MTVYKPIFLPHSRFKFVELLDRLLNIYPLKVFGNENGRVLLLQYHPEKFNDLLRSKKYYYWFNFYKMRYFVPTTKNVYSVINILTRSEENIKIIDLRMTENSFKDELIEMFNSEDINEDEIKQEIDNQQINIYGAGMRIKSSDIELYSNGTFSSDDDDKEVITKLLNVMQRSLNV